MRLILVFICFVVEYAVGDLCGYLVLRCGNLLEVPKSSRRVLSDEAPRVINQLGAVNKIISKWDRFPKVNVFKIGKKNRAKDVNANPLGSTPQKLPLIYEDYGDIDTGIEMRPDRRPTYEDSDYEDDERRFSELHNKKYQANKLNQQIYDYDPEKAKYFEWNPDDLLYYDEYDYLPGAGSKLPGPRPKLPGLRPKLPGPRPKLPGPRPKLPGLEPRPKLPGPELRPNSPAPRPKLPGKRPKLPSPQLKLSGLRPKIFVKPGLSLSLKLDKSPILEPKLNKLSGPKHQFLVESGASPELDESPRPQSPDQDNKLERPDTLYQDYEYLDNGEFFESYEEPDKKLPQTLPIIVLSGEILDSTESSSSIENTQDSADISPNTEVANSTENIQNTSANLTDSSISSEDSANVSEIENTIEDVSEIENTVEVLDTDKNSNAKNKDSKKQLLINPRPSDDNDVQDSNENWYTIKKSPNKITININLRNGKTLKNATLLFDPYIN